MLEIRENGIQRAGTAEYLKSHMPEQCKPQTLNPNSKTRLSLRNYAGAFAILLIGYIWAILVFIGEKLFFKCNRGLEVDTAPRRPLSTKDDNISISSLP